MVAGIRAGMAYNTFPSMNGYVVPPEILMLDPWYLNPLLQHGHRAVRPSHDRVASRVRSAGARWRSRAERRSITRGARRRGASRAALAVQIALGIATLLLRVPVPLAAMHQAGAVLLFAAALNVAHALRTRPDQHPALRATPRN